MYDISRREENMLNCVTGLINFRALQRSILAFLRLIITVHNVLSE